METESSGGWGRVLIRFSVDTSRVPRREDVTWKIKKFKYLDLQYLDIIHSNATYVKGLQEKYPTEKHFKVERVIH